MSRRVGTEACEDILAPSGRELWSSAARGRLPCQQMLLEPGIGLLFDDGGVAVRHARRQDGCQIFILFVATSASQNSPEVGLIHVFGDAASAPIERSQLGLGRETAMIGGTAEPAKCLLLVAR